MAGRKPKPTYLKLIAGNPGKRPLNENEPKPDKVIPICPEHLMGGAKKEWERTTKLLDKIGILTEIDGDALSIYCQLYSDWIKLQKEKNKPNFVFSDDRGRKNPLMTIQNELVRDIKSLCAEFGMTPSSRSRLSVPGIPKKNKFDNI
ncbi:MAG: phage terminase small subunit P27 family [Spirochaetes bacterium]|nr:phage terminase small subunit P27 family [Spirochaetota bacterium]